MTETILKHIEPRIGEGNAITAYDLSRYSGVSERDIRSVIGEIIKDYPILSGNSGYWIADSVEEIEGTIARLVSHAKSEMRHARKLKKHIEKFSGQRRLF